MMAPVAWEFCELTHVKCLKHPSPAWLVGWASSHKVKGCPFDSQQGTCQVPGPPNQVPGEGRGMRGNQLRALWYFFPSLSPSHPLCLEINKIFSKCLEQFLAQFNNYWLLLALVLGGPLIFCRIGWEVKHTVALTLWNLITNSRIKFLTKPCLFL